MKHLLEYIVSVTITSLVLLLSLAQIAPANVLMNNLWDLTYTSQSNNNAGCALCHDDAYPSGSSATSFIYNGYGQNLKYNPNISINIVAAFRAVESLNSDGDPDGFTNLEEINADAQPGWTSTAPFGVTGNLDPLTANQLIQFFIERLYQNILGRSADTAGLAYWTDIIQAKSACFVVQGFFYSQEFADLNLNDEAFVEILYWTIFDREADDDGKDHWVSQLQNGVLRDMVLYGFLLSQEFRDLSESCSVIPFSETDNALYQIKLFVVRFYQLVLQRNPEVGGYNYWTEELFNGTLSASEIAINFFFSTEFMNQNHDDSSFIDIAYQTILNRTADQGGKDYWMSQLASTLTRLELINGFIGSQEFQSLAESYGIRVN